MVHNFVEQFTQNLAVSIAVGLPAFKTAFLPLDTTQTNFIGREVSNKVYDFIRCNLMAPFPVEQ